MSGTISERLEAMGVTIPEAAAPAANYLPWIRSGELLLTSGQLPLEDGKLIATGKLGKDVDLELGQKAARQCAINILAQAKAALGDLENIKRLVKITVFVASDPEFSNQHLVANGASDFLAEVLGDAGFHARSAVGVPVLPLNAAVEIEAIIEVK
ncbi:MULTISPECIES: RidA family protein [Ahrensia]|jgi:enamine deaminase RidA (YjgF/YER057c/UK114 family)|uniref:RidA family protein n=1 Tax=Ahrensia kielensis TaxID=76980 RepID=A0ABU9T3Y0_9HYPH|nr:MULTISPECIES: RidA family protein [Ahrensia]